MTNQKIKEAWEEHGTSESGFGHNVDEYVTPCMPADPMVRTNQYHYSIVQLSTGPRQKLSHWWGFNADDVDGRFWCFGHQGCTAAVSQAEMSV
jgi:hypothetical protein